MIMYVPHDLKETGPWLQWIPPLSPGNRSVMIKSYLGYFSCVGRTPSHYLEAWSYLLAFPSTLSTQKYLVFMQLHLQGETVCSWIQDKSPNNYSFLSQHYQLSSNEHEKVRPGPPASQSPLFQFEILSQILSFHYRSRSFHEFNQKQKGFHFVVLDVSFDSLTDSSLRRSHFSSSVRK